MTSTCIDGHVHFYSSYSLAEFLLSAERNFDGQTGVLLMAQPNDLPAWSFVERQLSQVSADWNWSKPDACSLQFKRRDTTLVMIAGRQVVTREGLEVLSLCADSVIPKSMSIQKTIEAISDAKGVPVIPWGFGKWWFSRGRLLRNFIEHESRPHALLLGDSGCRPSIAMTQLLDSPSRFGIHVLAGSDPLPIKSHAKRPGSYYSIVSRSVDLNQPTAWMRQLLSELTDSTIGGSRSGFVQFLLNQIQIRIARHE